MLKPLDDFLQLSVTPVMKGAGYRRSGRKYVTESERGTAAVLQFRPFDTATEGGFLADWAVVPAAIRDYYAQGKPGRSPQVSWGILQRTIFPPEAFWVVSVSNVWKYSYANRGRECGDAIAQLLDSSMIPKWHELLDNENLDRELATKVYDIKEINDATTFWHPLDLWSHLVVHIDDGDPSALAEIIVGLRQAVPEDDRIEWFANRLNQRMQ